MTDSPEHRLFNLLYREAGQGRSLELATAYRDSAIRIRGSLTLAYPSAEADIGRRGQSSLEVISRSFGLTGALGALPYVYSDLIAQRVKDKDGAIAAFYDLFNHRAVTLLYQAWLAQRWPTPTPADAASRAGREHAGSKSLRLLGAMTGVPLVRDSSLRTLQGDLINHAGLFARRTRTAKGLVSILKSQFGMSADIEEFVGKWLEIAPSHRCRLSSRQGGFQLGYNTSVGKATWHPQSCFKVHLQVANPAQYEQLAPDSSQLKLMQQLIRAFVGDDLHFQIVIHVDAAHIPRAPLNGQRPSDTKRGIRLGWNSVLGQPQHPLRHKTTVSRDYSKSAPR